MRADTGKLTITCVKCTRFAQYRCAPSDTGAAVSLAIERDGWGCQGGKMVCPKCNEPLRHWDQFEELVPLTGALT